MEEITARMVLSCPAENSRRAVQKRNVELVGVRVVGDDVAGPRPSAASSGCDTRASRCAVNDRKSLSAGGERGEEGGRDANHLTYQFLIGNQKHITKDISRAENAMVGRN
jgi:hypothetical protein